MHRMNHILPKHTSKQVEEGLVVVLVQRVRKETV